jgi:hypothetical protein
VRCAAVCRYHRHSRADDLPLLAGEAELQEYRFHTNTAQRFFCRTCGICPLHRKRMTPHYFGVNVYGLEGFEPDGIPVRATVRKDLA